MKKIKTILQEKKATIIFLIIAILLSVINNKLKAASIQKEKSELLIDFIDKENEELLMLYNEIFYNQEPNLEKIESEIKKLSKENEQNPLFHVIRAFHHLNAPYIFRENKINKEEYMDIAIQASKKCLERIRGEDLLRSACKLTNSMAEVEKAQVSDMIPPLTGVKELRDLCLEITKLDKDLIFVNHLSLKATAHLILSRIYRLAPDSYWVDLLFGIRGDLSKSRKHIEKALSLISYKKPLELEALVTELCYYTSEESDKKSIIKILKKKLKDLSEAKTSSLIDRSLKANARGLVDQGFSDVCSFSGVPAEK